MPTGCLRTSGAYRLGCEGEDSRSRERVGNIRLGRAGAAPGTLVLAVAVAAWANLNRAALWAWTCSADPEAPIGAVRTLFRGALTDGDRAPGEHAEAD